MLPAKLLQLIFLHEINAVREGLKNHRITNTRKKSYYVNTILFVFVFSKDCWEKKVNLTLGFFFHIWFTSVFQSYTTTFFCLWLFLTLQLIVCEYQNDVFQSINFYPFLFEYFLRYHLSLVFFQRQSSTNFNSLFSSTVCMKRYQKMPIILLLEAWIG